LTPVVNTQEFIKLDIIEEHYSCFYKGVLLTSVFSKGELLHDFLNHTGLKFEKIIFIDDRREYLEDIENACIERKLKFQGVHFHVVKNLPGTPHAHIMEIQQNYLLSQAQWLEDDEAALYLDNK
jgi:hypothetical protein